MEEELTQQLTQGVVDPRREGRNNSGLSTEDISDVLCILHPCTPAAFKLVMDTAQRAPQHVLQESDQTKYAFQNSPNLMEEAETFILDRAKQDLRGPALEIALRFSSQTKKPWLGFVFGRNAQVCDVVIASESHKRVSNVHFAIYVNSSGVLMLQDMSTNGTMVDHILLKQRNDDPRPPRHMLTQGSIIQILSPSQDEILKFIVVLPSRDGHEAAYEAKFQNYMQRVARGEQHYQAQAPQDQQFLQPGPFAPVLPTPAVKAPLVRSQFQFGMHWTGGPKYNVVGHVGKGAFANVYQLATKSDGTLYAAKELEKRKFMKNGILDRKLDNEMTIMRAINHPNIVKYIEYQDIGQHLYIIMEFVPYGDLQQLLNGGGPVAPVGALREDVARRMAGQVFHALHYLHEQMITHRDIKPDNILIADVRPDTFTVKLSDFGLSKVVKDNDTFLKTFCGTLLYCAPEVFPHWDAQHANKGIKRTRNQRHSNSRSYSQAVDIWSFGAVLWYALCLMPPFEGVADKDGRGMFDKIMGTPLNIADLMSRKISPQAIALLVEMMNTDPMARPSPYDCLHHPWFGRGQIIPQRTQAGLSKIVEEASFEEPNLSQLSIAELERSRESEVSLGSSDLEFFQSKRFKPDAVNYSNQESALNSSGELFAAQGQEPEEQNGQHPSHGQGPSGKALKLFGEISRSDLVDWAESKSAESVTQSMSREEEQAAILEALESEQQETANKSIVASPSLLGAEEMVREMNMDSPFASKTRDVNMNTLSSEDLTPTNGAHKDLSSIEKTPKPPHFDRQITLPLVPSLFYNTKDRTTHNLEYASKVSGHDFLTDPRYINDKSRASTTPNSKAPSKNSLQSSSSEVDSERDTSAPQDSAKGPTCLGRLVSTPDSFASITLEIHQRRFTWGRGPSNSIVFPDQSDIRIPKHALTIYHHAPGIDDLPQSADFTHLSHLYTGIITNASGGIKINGVTLKKGTEEEFQIGKIPTGKLHTGDEITITGPSSTGAPGLRFRCEFYYGDARNPRSNPFKVELAHDASQREKTAAKKKRREKEKNVS